MQSKYWYDARRLLCVLRWRCVALLFVLGPTLTVWANLLQILLPRPRGAHSEAVAGGGSTGASPSNRSAAQSAAASKGYIRWSLRSTAQPLYARCPIIFSSCFSKATVVFIPNRAAPGGGADPARRARGAAANAPLALRRRERGGGRRGHVPDVLAVRPQQVPEPCRQFRDAQATARLL
jgi:hypothetical protein